MRIGPALTVISLLACGAAGAECLSEQQAAALADHFSSKTPAPDLAPMTAAQAHCSRARLNAQLAKRLGTPIGYKVGLTNPAIRRMLKGEEPAWGVLYPGMLLPGGSALPAAFGARPTVEADVLVRVRSSAIHEAKTPLELLQSLDQVIPFIELPDMLVANPLRLDAHGMAALNMSARFGVTGKPVPVPDSDAGRQILLDALGTMKLTMTDGNGKMLGQGVGSDLMGHPMHAALWLVQALTKEGIRLQPGQFLSLGSYPPVMLPRPGMKFVLEYQGLPCAEPVWVQFTP